MIFNSIKRYEIITFPHFHTYNVNSLAKKKRDEKGKVQITDKRH